MDIRIDLPMTDDDRVLTEIITEEIVDENLGCQKIYSGGP